jgi:hypothetical protein
MAGNGERKQQYSMKKRRENIEEKRNQNESGVNRPKGYVTGEINGARREIGGINVGIQRRKKTRLAGGIG